MKKVAHSAVFIAVAGAGVAALLWGSESHGQLAKPGAPAVPASASQVSMPPIPPQLAARFADQPRLSPSTRTLPPAVPSELSPAVIEMAARSVKPPVEGVSASNDGVRGETTAKGYAGVRGVGGHSESAGVSGENSVWGTRGQLGASRVGVIGEANNGTGVYGHAKATGPGVIGEGGASGGAGVVGKSKVPAAPGVHAEGSGPTGTALRVSRGSINVTGAGVGTPTPVFSHEVTAENSYWGCRDVPEAAYHHWKCTGQTTIDHPLLNGDPNAFVFITMTGWVPRPEGPAVVWYSRELQKWIIDLPWSRADGYGVDPSVLDPRGKLSFNVLIVKR